MEHEAPVSTVVGGLTFITIGTRTGLVMRLLPRESRRDACGRDKAGTRSLPKVDQPVADGPRQCVEAYSGRDEQCLSIGIEAVVALEAAAVSLEPEAEHAFLDARAQLRWSA